MSRTNKKIIVDEKPEPKKPTLITNANDNSIFPKFESDRKRIQYVSNAYGDMSIAEAFARYYNKKKPKNVDEEINKVTVINVGDVYLGNVLNLEKGLITFTIPGVKEQLICQENLNLHIDGLRNYCLNHENKMYFEVREKRGDKYMVSVINAYYRIWQAQIEQFNKDLQPISVRVDNLVKGGYVCTTSIWTINDLLGLVDEDPIYTASVFVPGSQIVLNIEKDFEKWVGQTIEVIPQNFVDFRVDRRTKLVEKSLIASRKRYLESIGHKHLYAMWQKQEIAKKLNAEYTPDVLEGKVTGIINSAKKTGVFVEIVDKSITGLLPIKNASELVNYHPGDGIMVQIAEFEVQEGKQAFVTSKDGSKVYKCNCRPVFEIA